MDTPDLASRVRRAIRDVPDFPHTGILFRDITPLLADAALFADVIAAMAAQVLHARISALVGIESRGFLFGVPLAQALRVPFIPARKPGKFPRAVISEAFQLEYGTDTLSIHTDAFGAGDRVLVVDDVLATGGTVAAACRLVERLGATVAGISVLSELSFLGGRERVPNYDVHIVISYPN